MNKRNSWTRPETLVLLDILQTTCLGYLDGNRSNRKGELYRHIESELRQRDSSTVRDARQIENKWKNLKYGYDKYKQEVESGVVNSKPCEYLKELDELFFYVAANQGMVMNTNVETIEPEEDIAYYEDELVAEESQDLSADEDTVVIEEIVYDSQDALEFEEPSVASTSTTATPKRKKLTAEHIEALLEKISSMQKEHDDKFIHKQMELIENEFEAYREKEKEHWLQLKLDLEELKEKYLERIRKIAHGDASYCEGIDEPIANETKRRRTAAGSSRRK